MEHLLQKGFIKINYVNKNRDGIGTWYLLDKTVVCTKEFNKMEFYENLSSIMKIPIDVTVFSTFLIYLWEHGYFFIN